MSRIDYTRRHTVLADLNNSGWLESVCLYMARQNILFASTDKNLLVSIEFFFDLWVTFNIEQHLRIYILFTTKARWSGYCINHLKIAITTRTAVTTVYVAIGHWCTSSAAPLCTAVGQTGHPKHYEPQHVALQLPQKFLRRQEKAYESSCELHIAWHSRLEWHNAQDFWSVYNCTSWLEHIGTSESGS